MKQILLAYALVGVMFFALLAVLGYGYGAGYVYVYWRAWQLQTNVFVALLLITALSLLLQIAWYFLKRRLRRQQRQTEQPLLLETLHPYEQLGVMWLLNTAQQQQPFITQIFAGSGLLQHIVSAKLSLLNHNDDQAQQFLKQVPCAAFELAELLHIEILLRQHQTEQAFTRLEFLQQQPISPWLAPLQPAFQSRLAALWSVLALQRPWLYLRSTGHGYLLDDSRDLWLQQLLQQFEQADYDDLQALQQRYVDLQPELATRPFSTQVLWLKLLARLPDLSQAHEQLALQLLQQQFDQDVFYLWFQQKLLSQNPDYRDIENRLDQLEQQYPSMPILSFARWHVCHALGQEQQASALLNLYPENVLMSYLRIKCLIKDDAALIQQLNLIFNNDAKFIQFKI